MSTAEVHPSSEGRFRGKRSGTAPFQPSPGLTGMVGRLDLTLLQGASGLQGTARTRQTTLGYAEKVRPQFLSLRQ